MTGLTGCAARALSAMAVAARAPPPCSTPRRVALPAVTSVQPPRLFGQHDRNAVADRIGELGGARNELLLFGVVFQHALGQRTDQDFQKLRIDAAGGTVGGRGAAHDG